MVDKTMNDHQVEKTAEFERDANGNWLVHLVEEPRAHTYGRTFSKAVRNIREVAAMWFDVGEDEVTLHLRSCGADLDTLVGKVAAARADAEQAQIRSFQTTTTAVDRLVAAGLAERDIAELIGLSHQRVHQLISRGQSTKIQAGAPAPPRLEAAAAELDATQARLQGLQEAVETKMDGKRRTAEWNAGNFAPRPKTDALPGGGRPSR